MNVQEICGVFQNFCSNNVLYSLLGKPCLFYNEAEVHLPVHSVSTDLMHGNWKQQSKTEKAFRMIEFSVWLRLLQLS